MGGKAKQAQRTKNNSRPANSGRSQDLISTHTGFVGFSSLDTSILPVVQNFVNIEANALSNCALDDSNLQNLDDNFQITLRKMTKKDPTTKTKALQEFHELIQKTDVEILKAVLPFWPRLYCNLSMDCEHRVRECAQQAQAAIVLKVGKNIAPYLRQLAPQWIISQYDTYAPAASIATQSFNNAFPQNKLREVFVYCEQEIIDLLVKNLIQHTAITLTNPKSHTPEECEAKYQRVLVASLRGYVLYLQKISEENLQKSASKNFTLLDNPKFWSYFKHKIPNIRAAWFEVISTLLQHGLFLLENHHQQLTTSVFQYLDETEPISIPHIWACVILTQTKIPNWNKYLNFEKAVYPKLWKVLKSGSGGNAAVVFPHMLPFISKFSREILAENLLKFYGTFFENVKQGLQSVAGSSRSDASAISHSYYEIIQYVIIQLLKDPELHSNELERFCTNLLDEHLIAIIDWCINSETTTAKYIFHNLSILLDYWCTHSVEHKIYQELLKIFWTKLFQIIEQSINVQRTLEQLEVQQEEDSAAGRIERITNAHIELVSNLKRTTYKRVKFSPESTDQIDGGGPVDEKLKHELHFEKQLNELVYKICKLYIQQINATRNSIFILHLENLIRNFQSIELFQYLLSHCDVDAHGQQSIQSLFDNEFSKWLHVDSLRLEEVAEIILILYKYLNADERLQLLNKWIKHPNKTVQTWIILRALSHPLCQEPNIHKTLQQREVEINLIDCAKAITFGDNKTNLILLNKCFFVSAGGGSNEILINLETCEKIIEIISEPLTDSSRVLSKDTCASFLAQILPAICSEENTKFSVLCEKLFLKLFEFSVVNIVEEYLTEDTLWEVTTAWQDSLSSEDIRLTDKLLDNCSEIINRQLLSEWSNEHFERLVDISAKLIQCSTEYLKNEEISMKMLAVDKILVNIFRFNHRKFNENKLKLENLALFIEALNGCLTNCKLNNDSNLVVNEMEFCKILEEYLTLCLFKVSVIFKLSVNPDEDKNKQQQQEDDCMETDEDYGDDDDDENNDLIKNWTTEFYTNIFDVFYAGSIGDIILYSTTRLHENCETLILNLQEKLSQLLAQIPTPEISGQIKEKLFKLANENGLLWSKAILFLLNLQQYNDKENGAVLLYEDVSTIALTNEDTPTTAAGGGGENHLQTYINILQTITRKMSAKCLPILPNLFEHYFDILIKMTANRCLIQNHFAGQDFNNLMDRKIIGNSLIILHEVLTKQKMESILLYNCQLTDSDMNKLIFDSEVANLIADILKYFPTELDISRWDFIRIALSSWILTVSKNHQNINVNSNLKIFISSIFKLFSQMCKFICEEKTKSSTELLTNVIEEWENVFAKDCNLVLLKSFINLITNIDNNGKSNEYFLDLISQYIDSFDFSFVLQAKKIDSNFSLDDLIKFSLDNISHRNHNVRIACATIIKKITPGLIKEDFENLTKRNNEATTTTYKNQENASETEEIDAWHFLHKFNENLLGYSEAIGNFIENFNFKIQQQYDFSVESTSSSVGATGTTITSLPQNTAISYLLLWDCIVNICSLAPPELRSIYASWITSNHFEQILLPALFKMMPPEILKNPDSGLVYGQTMFSNLDWTSIKNVNITTERYACHLYAQTLRHLSAIARKWWHGCNPRHAAIIDKLTTNCISNRLCQEEFQALLKKKEGQEQMHIKVHNLTREVTAIYALDEAKLELHITLPVNHPLGPVKVECGNQIGTRMQSKQVVMQLTIFLTHQNGSIWDGLSLWKRNLDRKFEGVEECYVCYSVIHQDTCQLPRLSCKTCKKKFHGPCLYRWFSTSNKSTCPICRNIF
uniref:E3 ubiquitin-protein ligase listerin n=1 Tax=Corethrella appendiculata TaxID=1370023 RepID=W4VS17_9DIPT